MIDRTTNFNKKCSFLILLILVMFIASSNLFAQGYPAQEFRSPLGIPIVLAGTFGELRSNHFHAGLDIKTKGSEGYRIYAIGDGYVSRIKVQSGGYGKAIYVDHPNGYTSVYCHLSVFKDEIGRYVEQKQYERQSFEVDLYLQPGEIMVNKNQIIALSGNSGSSSAPHLHFEIRRTSDEHPLNPLMFFEVPDSKAPILNQLGIIAFNEQGILSDNTINIPKNNTPAIVKLAQPRIGISLHAYDLLDGANNKNGVYSIRMFDNGNLVYQYTMDEFDFGETRYLNSHIHYPTYCEHRRREHRCYREPANQLNNYKTLVNDGIVNLHDGQVHVLSFEIADIKNNITRHTIKVQYDNQFGRAFYFPEPTPYIADWGFPYLIEGNNFVFETDQASLYNKLYLEYDTDFDQQQNQYSAAHAIGPDCYAFHKACTVKIRPFQHDSAISNKLLIAHKNDKGRIKGLASEWEGDFLKANTKAPGTFFVTSDTKKPVIKSEIRSGKKSFTNNDKISFKVSDDLSGIKHYNAYIDGAWVLLDYDAKNRRLSHKFSSRTLKGVHDFLLIVEDACGNRANYQFSFNKL